MKQTDLEKKIKSIIFPYIRRDGDNHYIPDSTTWYEYDYPLVVKKLMSLISQDRQSLVEEMIKLKHKSSDFVGIDPTTGLMFNTDFSTFNQGLDCAIAIIERKK